MNFVRLEGILVETPTSQWVAGVKEAWIWLRTDSGLLAVLCRLRAATDVCRCVPGAFLELTGPVRQVELRPGVQIVTFVATSLSAIPAPIESGRRRELDWERDDGSEDEFDGDFDDDCFDDDDFDDDPEDEDLDSGGDCLMEVSEGLYYDAFSDDYVGSPD